MNIEQLTKHGIKPQSVAHKVLGLLVGADGYISCSAIRFKVAPSKRVSDIRELTIKLQGLGLVINDREDRSCITNAGITAYTELGILSSVPAKPRGGKAKRAEIYERPIYDAAELGRTCMRPGAYDAYMLPSVLGGKRVIPTWRKL